MKFLAKSYVQALRIARKKRNLEIFVAPLPFSLHASSSDINQMNNLIQETIFEEGGEKLKFISQEVASDSELENGDLFNEWKEFDGTHFHPNSTILLQRSLSQLIES